MGAVGPITTSGPADVLENSELLFQVLGILVAALAVVDVSTEKIPKLSPKANWVLTVVSNVESGNCEPALPECIMLPLTGLAAGEVRPIACAGTINFPNSKKFLGCCPIIGPRCVLQGGFRIQEKV